MEKMLVTQALDERDLLVKRINDKIGKAKFVDVAKGNADKTVNNKMAIKDFENEAKATYQSINGLIDRFIRIDQAISKSNATTEIETSFGKMTVAAAISFRGRLNGGGGYGASANFELRLIDKLEGDAQSNTILVDKLNEKLQTSAEGMRLSILGKDTKVKDDQPLAVVDAYVKENTAELVDPIGAKAEASKILETIDTMMKEIDTKIKVSNATTILEF